MASKRKARFKVGQVVRTNDGEFAKVCGETKSYFWLSFGGTKVTYLAKELRPLTAREKGGKET